ncbi:MAG TPA: YihY/virulence factor BrkB family protein [Chitinophagaceae bacterium]|nr:YihY/virulence factor BrkB family protein [Chitinophagaceae bacterium]
MMKIHKLGNALLKSFKYFSEDKILKYSASLAYTTVFSMGPLLIVIIFLASFFYDREAAAGKIFFQMQEFVGKDAAKQLQTIIENASISGKKTFAATIGIATLLVGSTAIFAEIQDSINSIWGLKAKPRKGIWKMLRNRFLSFSVVISLGFLLLVSLAIATVIEGVSDRLTAQFPNVAVVFFYILNLIITFVITSGLFAVIFKILPDATTKWKDVLPGAIASGLLFMLGKFGISFYVSRSDVASTYGAAGSLVILLLWVYYSAIILYLGAEFSKAWAVQSGSNIRPNDYAVAFKQVDVTSENKIVKK